MPTLTPVRRISAILLLLAAAPLFADPPVTAPSAPPRDSTPEIELQRKLDQPFTLALQKIELSEAFKQIAAAAQISLQVDPACYDFLPYGATTRVSADFRQSKLRDAIEQVLVPLSLTQTISGPVVIIRPSGPLARIGRRADWDELKLLQDLRTGPDLKLDPAGNFDWTAALRASLDSRPNLVVAIANDAGGASGTLHDKALDQLKKQLPLSPFRALELYCQLTSQVWFVEAGPSAGPAPNASTGGTILIMPVRRWIDRQLQRPIKIEATNAPLEQVIADLSHASGIRFTPEPGLYQAIPMVSLNSNNSSVEETLKALSGAARIAYDILGDSVYLHIAGNNPPIPAATPASARTDAIVARIAVPVGHDGLSMDILIRESDLPPELNDLRKKKIQETIEALQKSLAPPPPPAAHPPPRHHHLPTRYPPGAQMTPVPDHSILGMTLADFSAHRGKHPQSLREEYRSLLRQTPSHLLPTPTRQIQDPTDGTLKFTLPISPPALSSQLPITNYQLPVPLETESVIIPMTSFRGQRWYTLCVSSQIGCRMACTFCETGRMGLLQNLTPAQIVHQRLVARQLRTPTPTSPADARTAAPPIRQFVNSSTRQFNYFSDGIQNLVFMGMGEPLDNFDNLLQALRVLSEPAGLDFPLAQITVSTVGRIDGLQKLSALCYAEPQFKNLRIAISLNAATDSLRSQIMPVNKAMPLKDLKQTLLAYPLPPKGRFLIEYVVIKNLNHSPADANAIADFCRDLPCIVNLIPYNPQNFAAYETPSEDSVLAFMAQLKSLGLFVKRRTTHGRSQMSACGQLGNPTLRRKPAVPLLLAP